MIPRYSRPVMSKIWDDENRFKIWFEIEAHAADEMANEGTIPKEAAKRSGNLGNLRSIELMKLRKKQNMTSSHFLQI